MARYKIVLEVEREGLTEEELQKQFEDLEATDNLTMVFRPIIIQRIPISSLTVQSVKFSEMKMPRNEFLNFYNQGSKPDLQIEDIDWNS